MQALPAAPEAPAQSAEVRVRVRVLFDLPSASSPATPEPAEEEG